MRVCVICIIIFINPAFLRPLAAQKIVEKEQQVWHAYQQNISLNEKWKLINEFHERHSLKPVEQKRLLVRTQVNYSLSKNFVLNGGVFGAVTNRNKPFGNGTFKELELTPHLQFELIQKLNEKFNIRHRYRLERRFFRNIEEDFAFNNFSANYRMRYMMEITYSLFELRDRSVELVLNDEIHLNAGKNILLNIFNQNRIYVAASVPLFKNLDLEAGYLKIFQQTQTGIEFIDYDIIRITLLQRF
jgi:hypothetical protein